MAWEECHELVEASIAVQATCIFGSLAERIRLDNLSIPLGVSMKILLSTREKRKVTWCFSHVFLSCELQRSCHLACQAVVGKGMSAKLQ